MRELLPILVHKSPIIIIDGHNRSNFTANISHLTGFDLSFDPVAGWLLPDHSVPRSFFMGGDAQDNKDHKDKDHKDRVRMK